MPTRDRMIRIRLITDPTSPHVQFRSNRRLSAVTRRPRRMDARAYSESQGPLGNLADCDLNAVPSYAGRLYAAVAT
jgi:hypothetical protein